MIDAGGALAFLIGRTTRNRVARQLARVRNPRYAIMAAIGIGYLWLAFARQPATAPAGMALRVGATVRLGAALLLTFTVAGWWLLGKVSSAFAFQPAEVQLLFPAPISRRGLIAYRVARSQLVLVLNALVWTVLLHRFGVSISAPLRFATAWAFFSILSLHRLGIALVQAPQAGPWRHLAQWAGKVVAALTLLAIIAGLLPPLLQAGSLGFDGLLHAIDAATASPPASFALAPFRLLLAPLFAASLGRWASDFFPLIAVLGVHLVWVLAMNVEFEESAATASVAVANRLAALRARRGGGPAVVAPGTKARGWLPLAPMGLPAVAIVWKNTIALTRTSSSRGVVILIVLALVLARFVMSAGGGHASAVDAIPFGAVVLVILLMGPRAIRNDLRQDLLYLTSLKSYPISATSLVAAEMASPVIVLAAFQLILVIAGYVSVPAATRASLDPAITAAVLVVSPIALIVLTAASIALQNAAALLFPAWVRLGGDSAGFEAMGQNLLVTFGSMFALALGLILPAVTGGAAWFASVLVHTAAPVAIGVATLVGTGVLAIEVALLVRALGGAFERIDPAALA